ncbi:unnamed protein product [Sphagnum troendelagicum]|uniref:Guanine nucleotide-binding protein subunit beta-like protein n=1 Tax=Sphagnum troendelagicum TaxID=128251 RepID=A0ABP0T9Q6_9BRYO
MRLLLAYADIRQHAPGRESCGSDCENGALVRYSRQYGRKPVRLNANKFKCCRTLQGYTGKIYALDWSYLESTQIVSASQDGRPIDGNLPVSCTLMGHKGYLSCCRYVPNHEAHILTSSRDQTCILWDAEANKCLHTFGGDSPSGYNGDIMSKAVGHEKHLLSHCTLFKVITNLGGGMGEEHCNWVSCLGMASDGSAVCTGSWDTSLKVSVFLVVDYKLIVFTDWISVPAALE